LYDNFGVFREYSFRLSSQSNQLFEVWTAEWVMARNSIERCIRSVVDTAGMSGNFSVSICVEKPLKDEKNALRASPARLGAFMGLCETRGMPFFGNKGQWRVIWQLFV
jgi:hypothetical protein